MRLADAEVAAAEAEQRRINGEAEMAARSEAINNAVGGFFDTLFSPLDALAPSEQAAVADSTPQG